MESVYTPRLVPPPPSRMLMVHCYDPDETSLYSVNAIFEAECELLHQHGTELAVYTPEIVSSRQLPLAPKTVWNPTVYQDLHRLIQTHQPEIVQFYHSYPWLSASAYYAAQTFHIPTIQALYDYRYFCSKATLYRDDQICELCIGQFIPWPEIYHRCWHQRWAPSMVSGALIGLYNLTGLIEQGIDLYLAPSEFLRQKYIQAGIPAASIVVNHPYVSPDPGFESQGGEFYLYIGDLSTQSGVQTLLQAWPLLQPQYQLQILGEGPLLTTVEAAVSTHTNISYLGPKASPTEVVELMGQARALIIASEWYDPVGMTFLKACARGTPVIAAAQGALIERVHHQQTGLLFEAGSPQSLAEQVEWSFKHPQAWKLMRHHVRQTFLTAYTAETHFSRLAEIYAGVLTQRSK